MNPASTKRVAVLCGAIALSLLVLREFFVQQCPVQSDMHKRSNGAAPALHDGANGLPPFTLSAARPQFIVFGDSLTEKGFSLGGWVALLAAHYSRRVDVVNRGYGGYNTRWCLQILPEIIRHATATGAPVRLVTIWLGANDAALLHKDVPTEPHPAGLPPQPGSITRPEQHVPLDEYRENLRRIVGMARQAFPEAHILLLTPPPVDDAGWLAHNRAEAEKWGGPLPTVANKQQKVTARYAAQCRAVAKDLQAGDTKLHLVDVEAALLQEAWRGMLSDGLHFNEKGNAAVFRAVRAVAEDAVPLESLPFDFPDWKMMPGGL